MTVAESRPAWVEVDLAAIRSNAAALAALVAPARLCAVVKANAYGHGASPVGRAAIDGGAAWLGVAVVEEGLELRQSGIDSEILVLADAPADSIAEAAAARLALTVSTAESIDLVARLAPSGTPVHLKMDTGMHRLGCDPADAVDLARRIEAAGLRLQGAMTHLACADDPAQDPLTARQLSGFVEAVGNLRSSGCPPELAHAASSAGALNHPDSRLDMVRCGITLYGYAPSPLRPLPAGLHLEPALSLKAQVSAVRDVAAGDGVGYGWRWSAEKPCRISTIPLGYTDGAPRALSGRGEVLLRGQRRQLAAVTMDQLMIECGDDAQVGDEVVLLGEQAGERITADDWAAAAGTISYEVLARLGARLPRRYV